MSSGFAKDLAFAAGLIARRPFSCLVQVTNRCNMQCSFCDFWGNGVPPDEELSVAEHQKLAAELASMGRFLVSVEGGEPLVRPDIVEIVAAYADRHIPAIFTNGFYVTPELARRLFHANLVHAGVSIDYATAERHDAERKCEGAFRRAWDAVAMLRDAAPGRGKQVHVITVLLDDNGDDLEPLLQRSAAAGVGHWVTLLSEKGYRRGHGAASRMPPPAVGPRIVDLWRRHPHLRTFRGYVELMEGFLSGSPMPTCRAGIQSFNVDHVGNVSACIEHIDRIAGSVRREPLAAIHARLAADRAEVERCQDCWTLCRASGQLMGAGASPGALWDLATRLRAG